MFFEISFNKHWPSLCVPFISITPILKSKITDGMVGYAIGSIRISSVQINPEFNASINCFHRLFSLKSNIYIPSNFEMKSVM